MKDDQEKKIALRKRLPLAVGLFVLFFVGNVIWGSKFATTIWIAEGAALTILLGIIATMVGFVVLRALFLLAGELSLLIFLAQSYCNVPGHSPASDAALKSLTTLGLLYIGISFIRFLYKALKEDYGTVPNQKSQKEKIAFVIICLMFMAMFLWEIFLVMKPIVLDLCVFK